MAEGSVITINPSGSGICVLDVKQQIRASGNIQVAPGKKPEIKGNPVINE